ncbi:MAG: hypothetical protein WC666_03250, partial [Candidatus Paceibacterota bacterium]
MATQLAIYDGKTIDLYDVNGVANPSQFSFNSGTLIIAGPATSSIRLTAPNGVLIGSIGAASNLIFEESSTISGQGTNTLSLGVSGDTFNLNVAGVTYNYGTLSGNPTFSGNVTISGTLTVNGTTSTINSTTVTIDDPIFTLGGNTVPTVDDNKDRGIEFRWHNGTIAKVGFFGFDDSTGRFTFIPDATNTAEVFTGTTGDIDIANVYTSGTLRLSSTGALSSITTVSSTYLVTTTNTVNFSGASTILQLNGTQIMDASRNLVNIGTISSGAITSSGDITLSGTSSQMYFTRTGAVTSDHRFIPGASAVSNQFGLFSNVLSGYAWIVDASNHFNLQGHNIVNAGNITAGGNINSGGLITTPPSTTGVIHGLRIGNADSYQAGYLQSSFDTQASFLIGHNMYVDSNGAGAASYKWAQTHGSFGSRGIEFTYNAGIKFYFDNAAATGGASFTPTTRMILQSGLTVGSTYGTGSGNVYVGKLYQGTTQVMD